MGSAILGQVISLCASSGGQATALIAFVRGDGDGEASGAVNDPFVLLLHLFAGDPAPRCAAACDADGDGGHPGNVTDAVYLLLFGFQGGPPSPWPFPACGHDAETALSCAEYRSC